MFAKIVFYVTANHGYTTKALLRFRSVKCLIHYRDSIHYRDICRVPILIVKIILLFSTNYCHTLTMNDPQFKGDTLPWWATSSTSNHHRRLFWDNTIHRSRPQLGCCRGLHNQGEWSTTMKSKLEYFLSGSVTTPTVWTTLQLVYFMCYMEQYINICALHKPGGSYTLQFLWKADHPPLPTKYWTYVHRLHTLIHELKATPSLFTTYCEILADQEQCGFIEKVQQQTVATIFPSCHKARLTHNSLANHIWL